MRAGREIKFWGTFAATFVLAMLLWSAFVIWLFRVNPTPDEYWVEKVLAVKHAALAKAGHPTLIITAGSSGLFGTRTGTISDVVGVPVVNAATYARLGMQGFFDDLNTFVQPGDAVVLALEYEHFSGDYMQKRYASHLLRNHLDLFPGKPPSEILQVLFSPTYWDIRNRLALWQRVRGGHDAYVASREFADSVDERGDFVKNQPGAKPPFQPERPLQKLFAPITPQARQVFEKNVRALREKNVAVFAAHPPKLLAGDYWKKDVSDFLESYRLMMRDLHIPLAEAMWLRFSPEGNAEFYDDDSHLLAPFAEARSRAVAEALATLPEFQEWKKKAATTRSGSEK